ncbi:transposase IS4 family protein [Caballeronia telluris]|uniref:Transposase IS4 family protein n=1 Tax=Caballeronia telluris TaxID=326475 RepID=A0A158KJW1_9BURK|nr:transposase IS4 family protein [Caballeronia telluris]
MRNLEQIKEQLKTQPDGQLSMTDPDARSMATSGKGSGMVGYNVQVAVDAKHHLIVAHEVTNSGSDRAQLSPMAKAAREAMGKTRLRAVADRGYYSGPQIKECADAGIAVMLPKPTTSGAK